MKKWSRNESRKTKLWSTHRGVMKLQFRKIIGGFNDEFYCSILLSKRKITAEFSKKHSLNNHYKRKDKGWRTGMQHQWRQAQRGEIHRRRVKKKTWWSHFVSPQNQRFYPPNKVRPNANSGLGTELFPKSCSRGDNTSWTTAAFPIFL